METKLKAGQKVLCIKSDTRPIVGKEVTIAQVDRDHITLKGFEGYWHPIECFALGSAVIKPTRDGGFRFNLIAPNNEKIATSEVYNSKQSAKKTLKRYFPDFKIIDKTISPSK